MLLIAAWYSPIYYYRADLLFVFLLNLHLISRFIDLHSCVVGQKRRLLVPRFWKAEMIPFSLPFLLIFFCFSYDINIRIWVKILSHRLMDFFFHFFQNFLLNIQPPPNNHQFICCRLLKYVIYWKLVILTVNSRRSLARLSRNTYPC